MTNLRDLMHQTVEHEHADMLRLAVRAKKRGTQLRRRRRMAVVGGSLAVLTVVGVGLATAGAFLPGVGGAGETSGYADQGASTDPVLVPGDAEWTPDPDCSDRRKDLIFTDVPEAGDALEAAVEGVAAGSLSEVRGRRTSATCHSPEMVSATGMLAPAPGGSADVQLSVSFLAPGEFLSAGGAEAYIWTCDGGRAGPLENCQRFTLPDGTKVRAYTLGQQLGVPHSKQRAFALNQPPSGVDITWQIAERLVDGHIINVNAIGPHAALLRDRIVDIAAQLTPIS